MPFEVILKELVVTVPHAIGAILVDWEGEAVMEHCYCEPYEIRFIAAHQGIILAHLKKMQSAEQSGEVEDVIITTAMGHLIIGCIDQDYSLVMCIERSCPVALALYHFRQSVADCKREI
jgi:predicted regulator of Ras-like GTPase activity (Roadblock/LC7/MglB family)